MAQASIITFPYNGCTYSAEVQIADGSIDIFVLDQRLHQILPGGKTSFKRQQGIRLNDQNLTPEQDLILCILGAMEQ